MIRPSLGENQRNTGVKDRLKPVHGLTSNATHCPVAVVNLAEHESMKQGQESVKMTETSYAGNLPERRGARSDGRDDVGLHSDVGVQVDSKIPDGPAGEIDVG